MADDRREIKRKVAEEKERHRKELHDKVAQEAMDNIQATRKQMEELRAQQRMDDRKELFEKGYLNDEHGKKITLWEHADRLANRAIGSEQNSYNDWRSAMMSLVSLLSEFVKALNQSKSELTEPLSRNAKAFLTEGIVSLKNTFLDKVRGAVKVDLPALVHDVKFTEGKVDFGKLTRSDGGEIPAMLADGKTPNPLANGAKTLVTFWLGEQDYIPAPGGDASDPKVAFVHKDTGELLTQDKFNELQAKHSLEQFLNEGSDLLYRPKAP